MTDITEATKNMSASDLATSVLAESLKKIQKYIQILYFERSNNMKTLKDLLCLTVPFWMMYIASYIAEKIC